MKFRVERDVLADAAAWVARSLPATSARTGAGRGAPGGHVRARRRSPDRLRLRLRDLGPVELAARSPTPGQVARLRPAARRHHQVRCRTSRSTSPSTAPACSIACGSAKFCLPTMPVEDYPQLPDHAAARRELPVDVFSEAVAQVAVAAGHDDTLPMLTGIRLEIEGRKVILAATDRFRLAVRELEWTPADAGRRDRRADPGETLSEAAKTLGAVRQRSSWLSRRATACSASWGGAAPRPGCSTPNSPRFRQLLPTEHTRAAISSSPRSSRRSSVSRWSPSAAPRCGWSSATTACCSPPVATTPAAPRRSSRATQRRRR